MKCDRDTMLLYAVTDRAWTGRQTLIEQIECALKGGATCVQLREKNLGYEEFLAEAIEAKALCAKYGVPLIINDDVEIALQSGADGVHLGQGDMRTAEARAKLGAGKIIGVTAKTVEQAIDAERAGADYLGTGAVFVTTTKPGAIRMTADGFQKIRRAVSLPIVAIGGINRGNILELAGYGADGVAVVSGIFSARDIEAECKELRACSSKIRARGRDIKKVLTIAGSDCSGGAGIQADIKTITAHKMYAMSAITALTAQNTLGVDAILSATPEFIGQQLDSIFTDIRPDSVKIGMVSNAEIIRVIVQKLRQYRAENIVIDPVMVSTSGCKLIADDARAALIDDLLPLGTLITPNIPEAEILCGFPIHNTEDMIRAAREIRKHFNGAILIKGGHLVNDATDLLLEGETETWFSSPRIDNPNTHGTGCTLSSAIACNLATGESLPESIRRAKQYLTGALAAMLDLGAGSGPLDHTYAIK